MYLRFDMPSNATKVIGISNREIMAFVYLIPCLSCPCPRAHLQGLTRVLYGSTTKLLHVDFAQRGALPIIRINCETNFFALARRLEPSPLLFRRRYVDYA